MGQPVVHFEVLGKDGDKLRAYYSDLFGWEFEDAPGPMDYGVVHREGNMSDDGLGISGGVGGVEGSAGHVTFYVGVPDVEAALTKAESLGGKRTASPISTAPSPTAGATSSKCRKRAAQRTQPATAKRRRSCERPPTLAWFERRGRDSNPRESVSPLLA